MADDVDRASKLEQIQREIALKAHRSGVSLAQELVGVRYCLDCGEEVPRKRIESVNADRCIECQTLLELKQQR